MPLAKFFTQYSVSWLNFKCNLEKDKQQHLNLRDAFTFDDWLSKLNFMEQPQKSSQSFDSTEIVGC